MWNYANVYSLCLQLLIIHLKRKQWYTGRYAVLVKDMNIKPSFTVVPDVAPATFGKRHVSQERLARFLYVTARTAALGV